MSSARSILPNYYRILDGEASAQYRHCKTIPVSFTSREKTEILWKKHDTALRTWNVQDTSPQQSLLDLKLELAHRIYHACCFCERRCMIDRATSTGDCGVQEARIASEFLHMGEEKALIPSHTVFFSGCTFHCVFCQNWDISQQHGGVFVKPELMAELITQRQQDGARNVNWVGGDPTSNLFYILKVLQTCDINLPQIWNSNMYCSLETMKLLHGIIDLYLTDFKYGNDACAERLSHVKNYTAIIKRNHLLAYNQAEIILRHLVLPHHIHCCSQPILSWIKKNIPDSAINIMAQYRPMYQANRYDDIAQPLSQAEYSTVKQRASELQLHEI